MRSRTLHCLAFALAALIGTGVGHAAFAAPADDWPCVQPRVPELSLGAFWSGPPLDTASTAWRGEPDIARLVTSVVSRRTPIEDAEKQIADFAGSHKDEKGALPVVFAASFAELNNLRTQIVHGIERFARNQRQLSDEINKSRAELNPLTAAAEKTDQQRARIQELQTQIQWQTRLHKERESALRYVCETPTILEQRVFAIARAVQNEM
jgi:hypothetical protein